MDMLNEGTENDSVRTILGILNNIRLSKSTTLTKEMKEKLFLSALELKKYNGDLRKEFAEQREKTKEKKQKYEKENMKVKNLQYELFTLNRSTKNCDSYESMDTLLDLRSKNEFLQEKNLKENDFSEHELHLKRLDDELEQRKKMENETKLMEKKKLMLEEELKNRQNKLEELPSTLKKMEDSMKELNNLLSFKSNKYLFNDVDFISHDSMRQFVEEDNSKIKLLISPLYNLYMICSLYSQLQNSTDNHQNLFPILRFHIEGDDTFVSQYQNFYNDNKRLQLLQINQLEHQNKLAEVKSINFHTFISLEKNFQELLLDHRMVSESSKELVITNFAKNLIENYFSSVNFPSCREVSNKFQPKRRKDNRYENDNDDDEDEKMDVDESVDLSNLIETYPIQLVLSLNEGLSLTFSYLLRPQLNIVLVKTKFDFSRYFPKDKNQNQNFINHLFNNKNLLLNLYERYDEMENDDVFANLLTMIQLEINDSLFISKSEKNVADFIMEKYGVPFVWAQDACGLTTLLSVSRFVKDLEEIIPQFTSIRDLIHRIHLRMYSRRLMLNCFSIIFDMKNTSTSSVTQLIENLNKSKNFQMKKMLKTNNVSCSFANIKLLNNVYDDFWMVLIRNYHLQNSRMSSEEVVLNLLSPMDIISYKNIHEKNFILFFELRYPDANEMKFYFLLYIPFDYGMNNSYSLKFECFLKYRLEGKKSKIFTNNNSPHIQDLEKELNNPKIEFLKENFEDMDVDGRMSVLVNQIHRLSSLCDIYFESFFLYNDLAARMKASDLETKLIRTLYDRKTIEKRRIVMGNKSLRITKEALSKFNKETYFRKPFTYDFDQNIFFVKDL
ncbi:hypothetical protein SNEBB_010030 [Seison nebaliae]|nr:hypothetical protein SNEBB_010030 [Seison nebaliae]